MLVVTSVTRVTRNKHLWSINLYPLPDREGIALTILMRAPPPPPNTYPPIYNTNPDKMTACDVSDVGKENATVRITSATSITLQYVQNIRYVDMFFLKECW